MLIPTLSVILLVGQLASAMPFEQVARNLPRDVAHIALDEANGQYLAYKPDGSLAGKYPADTKRDFRGRKRADPGSPCAKLAVEEAKQLPGFKQIEDYANKEWGTGKRNIVTNPTNADQAFGGATACVSNDVVQVEFSGSPSCNSRTGEVDGQAKETNGSITSSVASTYSNTGTWAVKTTSSIGVSAKVSAEFKIPEIAELGGEITTSAEFTSEVAHGFETTNTDTVNTGGTFAVPSGKKCQIKYDVKTCTVPGHGRVRYEASGFVWFEYDDKVQDHFKWAVNIEEIVKNVDDRSSFLEFAGSIKGTTNANFNSSCSPI